MLTTLTSRCRLQVCATQISGENLLTLCSGCEVQQTLSCVMSFELIPLHPLTIILRYLGKPSDFLPLLEVSTSWRDQFDTKNGELWWTISCDLKVMINSPLLKRSSRSTDNHLRVFLKAYNNRQKMLREKHDYLILLAKDLFNEKRDAPMRLDKLIKKVFPNPEDFDINWRSSSMENNSLLLMACRRTHIKCIRLLVEYYKSDINLCDIGGFTPLIMCAYHGNIDCVMYCLRKGADISAQGRLRGGKCLTAEHWAAVENNQDIYTYLRAIRIRWEKKAANLLQLPKHNISSLDPSDSSSSSSDADSLRKTLLQSIANDDPTLWNTNSFCTCGRGFVGQMIACESVNCLIEWYHFKCVGLEAEPKGDWYCPRCITYRQSTQAYSDDDATTLSAKSSSSSSAAAPPRPCSPSPPDVTSTISGYCICGLGFDDDMVACEAPHCLVEWYHFRCVGLVSEPVGQWICAACRGEKFTEPAKVLSPPHKKNKKRTTSTAGVSSSVAIISSSDCDNRIVIVIDDSD